MFEAADALGCWGQCGKVAYVATPIQKRPRKPNKSMAIELNDPMCEPSTLIYCLFRYRRNKPLVSALLQKLGACTRQAELRSSRTRPPSVCARHPSARAIGLSDHGGLMRSPWSPRLDACILRSCVLRSCVLRSCVLRPVAPPALAVLPGAFSVVVVASLSHISPLYFTCAASRPQSSRLIRRLTRTRCICAT